MEPVRIKLYGLFWVTKRRYLTQQILTLVFGLLLLGVWFFAMRLNTFERRVSPPTGKQPAVRLRDQPAPADEDSGSLAAARTITDLLVHLPWVVVPILFFAGIETIIMLLLFSQKEEALRGAGRESAGTSLVILLSEPVAITNKTLEQMLLDTFQVDLSQSKPDAEFVTGSDFMFMIQFRGQTFQLVTNARPYFESPEEFARQAGAPGTGQAIREHCAYVSISLVRQDEAGAAEDPYTCIGKMLVAIGRTNALALVWPAKKQVCVWDRQAEEKLRGLSPLEVFAAAAPDSVPAPGGPQSQESNQGAGR